MEHRFPRLYLLTDDNKIRFWDLWVTEEKNIAYLHTRSGLLDGKILEPIPQMISESVGKTTPFQRAVKYGDTKWKNKKKTGFSENLDRLKEKKEIIIVPMRPYPLQNKYLQYPAYVQPKVDGYRGLMHSSNGKIMIFSQRGNTYPHLAHIEKEASGIKLLNNKDIYLDGEIYLENYPIRVLKSVISKYNLDKEETEIAKKIKFYAFDMFNLKKLWLTYQERFRILRDEVFKKKYKTINLIENVEVKNREELDQKFTEYVKKGYEGIIIRNLKGVYKLRGKSTNVLKSKDVKKDTFKIAGYKEGSGNNHGTVIWKIECLKNKTKSFWAKPMGTREERRQMYKNCEKYLGKPVHVKYFEIDKDGCVTKSPVAYF